MSINQLLDSYGLQGIHPEWISQCIEYIQTNATNQSQILDLLLEQILHSDLSEMMVYPSVSALPQRIDMLHDIVLAPNSNSSALTATNNQGSPTCYILQINDIMEIGHSVHSMLNLILERKPKRGEPPTPGELQLPRKMLQLTLSDGGQICTGIEYTPMGQINLLTPLGTKILISNVRVSRGILLLSSANTKVLGGSISEMNALDPLIRLENTLKSLLNRGEDSSDDSKINNAAINSSVSTNQNNQTIKPSSNQDLDIKLETDLTWQPQRSMKHSQDNPDHYTTKNFSDTHRQAKIQDPILGTRSDHNLQNRSKDLKTPSSTLHQAEFSSCIQNHTFPPTTNATSIDSMHSFAQENVNTASSSRVCNPIIPQSSLETYNTKPSITADTSFDSYDDDDEIHILSPVDRCKISELEGLIALCIQKTVNVAAQLSSWEKLAVTSEGYSLRVTLNDKHSTCSALLSKPIIASRLGMSHQELRSLRSSPEGLKKLQNILKNFYHSLKDFCGVFTLNLPEPGEAGLEIIQIMEDSL
ncbi:hypothetical protein RTP6_001711 [Batrachochytrium dendrobatidis]